MKTFLQVLLLLFISCFLGACSFFAAPDDTFEKNLNRPLNTIPLASNFESIRQNIIRPKCARCHQPDSATDASKILFSTEDQLLSATNDDGKILVPGNASASTFFRVMSSDPQVRGVSEAMPPEKDILAGRSRAVTNEELKAVQLWIEGLPKGAPSEGSPTPAPTPSPRPPPSGPISGDLWNQVQQHVLASRCVTCHKAGGKAEKIPLETKAQVLSDVIDGQPMVVAGKPLESPFFQVLNDDNSLRHGLKKMPPLKAVASGQVSDVDDVDRKIVSDWILSLSSEASPIGPTNPEPEPGLPDPLETPQVTRGRYMYNLAGCVNCHTADATKPLAGGYKLKTTFGVFYTPNISPDVKTGIGGWSKANFLNAVRNGIAPNGEFYYPSFPYNSYSKMTDQDILSIQEYIMTLKPVSQKNRAHILHFPLNKRKFIYFWRAINFVKRQMPTAENFMDSRGVFQPIPGRDLIWNRGAYLVEGPLHCTQCHTPRNKLGGFIKSQWMAGAPIFGEKDPAPNLTSDVKTGLGGWTFQNWEKFLAEGVTEDGDVVGGDMAQIVKRGTSKLTQEDRTAVINYIQSLPPIRH